MRLLEVTWICRISKWICRNFRHQTPKRCEGVTYRIKPIETVEVGEVEPAIGFVPVSGGVKGFLSTIELTHPGDAQMPLAHRLAQIEVDGTVFGLVVMNFTKRSRPA